MSTSHYTAKDIQRFWSKVAITANNDLCWEWQVGRNQDGYGRFYHQSKARFAHRIAWELTNGEIIGRLEVCHSCDNPGCCNPKHLFLGTHRENIQDMLNKGRNSKGDSHSWRGEQSHNRKLTTEQVNYIRRRYADGGITQLELAQEIGISQHQISNVVRHLNWKVGS